MPHDVAQSVIGSSRLGSSAPWRSPDRLKAAHQSPPYACHFVNVTMETKAVAVGWAPNAAPAPPALPSRAASLASPMQIAQQQTRHKGSNSRCALKFACFCVSVPMCVCMCVDFLGRWKTSLVSQLGCLRRHIHIHIHILTYTYIHIHLHSHSHSFRLPRALHTLGRLGAAGPRQGERDRQTQREERERERACVLVREERARLRALFVIRFVVALGAIISIFFSLTPLHSRRLLPRPRIFYFFTSTATLHFKRF